MIKLKELLHYTQQLMQVERFKDYCPNGLQVEGRQEIKKIVTGVTASMALLEAAQREEADLILVHHGYFWKNEDPRVMGMKRNRLAFLLEKNLNLLAYHLQLDDHPELGNNVQLGKILGLSAESYAGETNLVAYANLNMPVSLESFCSNLSIKLGRMPMIIGDQDRLIKRVAWCTGAAQGYIDVAAELGADVYISGEISEQTTHQAIEMGIAYVSAGHHATERYGVQALGKHLAEKFNLEHTFLDIENPV